MSQSKKMKVNLTIPERLMLIRVIDSMMDSNKKILSGVLDPGFEINRPRMEDDNKLLASVRHKVLGTRAV